MGKVDLGEGAMCVQRETGTERDWGRHERELQELALTAPVIMSKQKRVWGVGGLFGEVDSAHLNIVIDV